MNIDRREFLKVSSFSGMAALAGCAVPAVTTKVEPKFGWSVLVHLGMNQWHERSSNYKQTWPRVTDQVEAAAIADEYLSADYVRFDEGFWDKVVGDFKAAGANQVVIDLGEALIYPSHPEIAVRGSWSADKLRGELRRLRAMGLEPIPKLNFSTTHDIWMGDYHRMVSSKKYYAFVSDIIKDVCEIFDYPRYFHIGMDEETVSFQDYGQSVVIVRQGELWWHDVLFYVKEVERHGSRAWCWSNCIRTFDAETYAKKMPKSVVQSPWWYTGSMDPNSKDSWNKPAKALYALARLGYDTVPCSSNCYSEPHAMKRVVELCDKIYKQEHLLGYQMAPWLEMNKVFAKRWAGAAADLKEAIASHV